MTLRIQRYDVRSFSDGISVDETGYGRDRVKWVIADAHTAGLMCSLGHDGFYGPSVARVLPSLRTELGLSDPLTNADLERLRTWFEQKVEEVPRSRWRQ